VAETKLEELRAAARPVTPQPTTPAAGTPSVSPAARRAGSVTRDARVAGVQWAYIPAQTFQMGCVPGDSECTGGEKPRHQVTLTRSFELMTTEVTIGMFRRYAQETGREMPAQPEWNTTDTQPVVNVTWDESKAFCGWLKGRLPTEAE
jgi:formylglycine-generating enzyme required for sulfatase activity